MLSWPPLGGSFGQVWSVWLRTTLRPQCPFRSAVCVARSWTLSWLERVYCEPTPSSPRLVGVRPLLSRFLRALGAGPLLRSRLVPASFPGRCGTAHPPPARFLVPPGRRPKGGKDLTALPCFSPQVTKENRNRLLPDIVTCVQSGRQ